ncbi:MAG: ribonuclease P protein component [Spirochaetia bacterium]|nr:ribonuclease P protein component [Spirochaetia bacterium]
MKQKILFLSLKNKKEITKIFNSGDKVYSKNVLIRYTLPEHIRQNLPLYVLIALPKKKLGAVKRNRLRRICKSALFQAMKKMQQNNEMVISTSFNIVIHAKEGFIDVPEQDRVQEFETLMTRLFKTKITNKI